MHDLIARLPIARCLLVLQATLLASACVVPTVVGDGYGSGGGDAGSVGSVTDGGDASGPGLASTSDEGSVDDTTSGSTESSSGSDAGGSGSTTGADQPDPTVLTLSWSQIKQFEFSWSAVVGAEHYRLLESAAPGDPFVQLGEDIMGESASFTMPLHLRQTASYLLQACTTDGCTDSASVSVEGSLAEAIGYFKASNPGADDEFGVRIAVSGDGNTLVVGAHGEDSSAAGIDGEQADGSAPDAGAVYVFVRDAAGQWSQQAYIKASNTGSSDRFGRSIALSNYGDTLAVGATNESSNATGIDGNQASDTAIGSGAVYVFVRDAMGQWSQQAYVKASNTGINDMFGQSVALSGDGHTLAVGALGEDSDATGIDGDQGDSPNFGSPGAVYVFVRDVADQWSQQAYVKASNTDSFDGFGWNVALSGDGHTLAVGARDEASAALGIDGDQGDDSASSAGAVYVFLRDAMDQWSQQAYVKASNTGSGDNFGWSVALSEDGQALAIGAPFEDGEATGIDGDELSDAAVNSGAVYVFERDAMAQWSQQAYVKASNTDFGDGFGSSVVLGSDRDILAVGARTESSSATGIGGDQNDDNRMYSGAAYVFARDVTEQWSQRSYLKASNTGANDSFGESMALSDDGNDLAVGAYFENGSAAGIAGDQLDATTGHAGAVYFY